MGWITPFASIELANSWRRVASNTILGCKGLGAISEMGREVTRPPCSSLADAAGTEETTACVGWTTDLLLSSADRPLPKTLRGCGFSGILGTSQDLLCELDIAFGSAGPNVVGQDWFSKAGSFRQAYAARDYSLEDGIFEEFPEILFHLAGQVHAVVIHG